MKKIICFFLLLAFVKISTAQSVEGKLLANWKDSTIIGTDAYDNAYNDVWGFTSGGHEYAVIGSTFGTHILDISNTDSIYERVRFQGKDFGDRIIHRDYHDYAGHLYAVSDEGASSMQIIKIDELPDTVYMAYDSDSIFVQSHNIFIDTAHARLYSFLTSTPVEFPTRGVAVYDISEPANPKYLKHYNEFGALNPNHIHDGYVRDNIAFLNGERSGLAIVDFTDLDNPNTIGVLRTNAYLQAGYNHSGWASDDCRHYYFADETWGMDLKALSLLDPEDLTVDSYFDAGNDDPNSIPHNLIVGCNYLYVSYYYDGLRVFDISDPSNPEQVMYYNTSSRQIRRNYEGAWGVYPHLPSGKILVSDMQEGLFVIEGPGDNCEPNKNLQPCFAASSSAENFPNELTDIEVFPNPNFGANFSIKITSPTYSDQADFVLTNLNGEIIFSDTRTVYGGPQILDFQLNTGLESGMYFLRTDINDKRRTKKLVVVNND